MGFDGFMSHVAFIRDFYFKNRTTIMASLDKYLKGKGRIGPSAFQNNLFYSNQVSISRFVLLRCSYMGCPASCDVRLAHYKKYRPNSWKFCSKVYRKFSFHSSRFCVLCKREAISLHKTGIFYVKRGWNWWSEYLTYTYLSKKEYQLQ